MAKTSGGVRGLSRTTNYAIEHYVSGEGMWINDYLRLDAAAAESKYGRLSAQDRAYLSKLDKAVSKKLGKDQVLYRSVDAAAIFGKISDSEYNSLEAVMAYGDKQRLYVRDAERVMNRMQSLRQENGFMSTTKSRAIAEQWGGFTGSSRPVVIKLYVPGDTKGVDLSRHRMAQQEVLLQWGLKYKINRIYGKHGNIYVDASIQ